MGDFGAISSLNSSRRKWLEAIGWNSGYAISVTERICAGPILRGEQYIWLACVVSVSVRFRSKERGTGVKDRAKKWDIFWFSFHFSHGQNWKSRFSSFLGLSLLLVSRKRLLRRLHALIPVRQSERARALLFRKEASAFSPCTIMLARLSRFSRHQSLADETIIAPSSLQSWV